MAKKPVLTRILRGIAIALFALTAVFTLLGGFGTSCVAFKAENFGPRMAALIPVKPIFQVLVVISIAAAIFGIYTTVMLIRSKKNGYTYSLIFLLVGLIASGIQFYYSATLRGSTAPNNVRLYLTGLTLLVFLVLRIPGIWQKSGLDVNGNGGSGMKPVAGASLFLTGLLTLTTPLWGAPTHVIDGFNTVNVLLWPLLLAGALQIATSLWLLRQGILLVRRKRLAVSARKQRLPTPSQG